MASWQDLTRLYIGPIQYLGGLCVWVWVHHGKLLVLCTAIYWVNMFGTLSEKARTWRIFRSPHHNVALAHTLTIFSLFFAWCNVEQLQRMMQKLPEGRDFESQGPEWLGYIPKSHTPMNYDLCAKLHNRIIETVWIGATGRSIDELETASWWEYYGDDALSGDRFLSPSLKEFFKLARMLPRGLQFFYYAFDLPNPRGDLWGDWQTWERYCQDIPRYVLLYHFGYAIGHNVGLIFDQEKSLALMQPQIDFDGYLERAEWLPLENILTVYLEMIDEGKVIPHPMVYQDITEEIDGEHVNVSHLKYKDEQVENDLNGGWRLVSTSEISLQKTIDAFDRLVETIENKIIIDEGLMHVKGHLQNKSTEGDAMVHYGLADTQTLDRAGITNIFHREFLRRVRKPRTGIRYIAPGIRIPTITELINQPFKEIIDESWLRGKPAMIFPGDGNAWTSGKVDEYSLKWNKICYVDSAFAWPYNSIKDYPSGVYMTDLNDWPEHATVVLPLQISHGSYARRADNIKWSGHKDLYSLGNNKFIYSFGTRLQLILDNWIQMVESGEWKVDVEGVVGGAAKFKDADTAEHWKKYQLAATW